VLNAKLMKTKNDGFNTIQSSFLKMVSEKTVMKTDNDTIIKELNEQIKTLK
jgi:hypothetical protein